MRGVVGGGAYALKHGSGIAQASEHGIVVPAIVFCFVFFPKDRRVATRIQFLTLLLVCMVDCRSVTFTRGHGDVNAP